MLSAVYLHHRRSQDLDFFSDGPFSHDEIIGFIRELRRALRLKAIEEKKIFNRWEFFLHDDEEIRLEFVHYDHPKLKPRKRWKGIFIDSLDDIAANKMMALFDRDEPKDLIDLYFLFRKGDYSVERLLKMVEQKFGVRLDKGTVWSEVMKLTDDLDNLKPLLLVKGERQRKETLLTIKHYFMSQTKRFLDQTLA